MLVTNNKSLILMGSIYTICSLMSFSHIYTGISVICILAIILRILSATHVIRPLSRFYIRIISFIGIFILAASALIFRNLADTFISLLMMGCALKFLEYANKRDLYVQCTALLFLTAVPLIFHYEFYILPYILAMCTMIIWAFVSITHVQTIREDFKLLFRIILPAVPVTIVMFLVLPRTGAFWVIPNINQTRSGITSVLNLNGLGNISTSDQIIARVVFHGNIPSPRYFRSIVYEKYSISGWTEGERDSSMRRQLLWYKYLLNPKPQAQGHSRTTDYDVILENTGTPYIPTLKYSNTNMKRVFNLSTDVFSANNSGAGRQYFHFTYLPDLKERIESIDRHQLEDVLSFNTLTNRQTQALVKELTQGMDSDEEKAKAILKFFASNNFRYTLSPGRYQTTDYLDELIFSRKLGYCVHYANAMALMLRMAGIPSRIVGGYMGGELNSSENYVILREYDAHAWVEAFINNRWVELDPTALVADWNSNGNSGEFVIGASNGATAESGMLSGLYVFKEYVDMQWTMFVLNFDSERQQSIFKGSIIAVLGLVVLSFITYIAIILFTSREKSEKTISPELSVMRKAVMIIQNKENVQMVEWHTYGRFCSMLAEKNSHYAELFAQMYRLYHSIHYQPEKPDKSSKIKELRQKLRELKKL